MKVTINKKELSSALANALKIASKTKQKGDRLYIITQSVMIEAHDGTVRISASNLDQTYQCDISAEVFTDGKAVVPCKSLFDIVSQYPENEIAIDETGNRWYKIGSETGPEYNVIGENPDDFPEISNKYGQSLEFDGKVFSDLVKKTCFIQDLVDMRPHVRGVLFSGDKDELRIYSTDGSMMSRFSSSEICDFSGKYIVSKVGLNSISIGENVSIYFSESTAFFETNGGTWGIRLLEGDFPFPAADTICNYQDPQISFDSMVIFDMLKRAKSMTNDEHKGMKLSFENNQVKAEVSNPENPEYKESIDLDSDNDVVLRVDVKRLYAIVNNTNGDSTTEIHGSKKPVIVRDGSFVFAVMPMTI